MKWTKFASLIALMFVLSAGSAFAGADDSSRQQSDISKMGHKLGRGVTNIVTCWLEWPRSVATEWSKTDPVSGLIVGTAKGFAWGFARLASGVYETITFPFPVPPNYATIIEPEFIVTDLWGAPIPELEEFGANDPNYPTNSPIYPERFNF